MSDASPAPTRVYRGSCHCGAVRFSLRSEEITRGLRCNCSICVRKGALMSTRYYAPDEILELRGKDTLAVYHFGDLMMNHWFCRTCGIFPFADPIEKPGCYRINLGCLEGVDTSALPVDWVDGRSF